MRKAIAMIAGAAAVLAAGVAVVVLTPDLFVRDPRVVLTRYVNRNAHGTVKIHRKDPLFTGGEAVASVEYSSAMKQREDMPCELHVRNSISTSLGNLIHFDRAQVCKINLYWLPSKSMEIKVEGELGKGDRSPAATLVIEDDNKVSCKPDGKTGDETLDFMDSLQDYKASFVFGSEKQASDAAEDFKSAMYDCTRPRMPGDESHYAPKLTSAERETSRNGTKITRAEAANDRSASTVSTPEPVTPVSPVAKTISPVEILRSCKIDPRVQTVSATLDGSNSDEIALRDCGNGSLFLTVRQTARRQICALDFSPSYIDAGFTIKPSMSNATVSTFLLPGSNGEPPTWTVKLTEESGNLSATSPDDVAPKVQCESE